jgi:isoleucyl-tRNA synthetase
MSAALNDVNYNSWVSLRNIRNLVNKELEEKRAAGIIGSALAADVDVYASGDTYEALKRLGEDLKFVFITSRATVHLREGGGIGVNVTASSHSKCERCWHYREDVGTDANHPALCGRCVSNLYGGGEERRYA